MTIKLNLADVDNTGTGDFVPLPAGWYDAINYEVTIKETKGGEGKAMPAKTPYLAVQFKIDGGEHDNRRVFANYMIPPASYAHADVQNKILFSYLEGIGYTEEEIRGWTSLPDLDDMAGRECSIKLSISKSDEYGDRNEVKFVKPRESAKAPKKTAGGKSRLL